VDVRVGRGAAGQVAAQTVLQRHLWHAREHHAAVRLDGAQLFLRQLVDGDRTTTATTATSNASTATNATTTAAVTTAPRHR
jgi:hypothetical protein